MKPLVPLLCAALAASLAGCASPPPTRSRAWLGGEFRTARDSLFSDSETLAGSAPLPWLPPDVRSKQKHAVFVSRVLDGTPAKRAGLREGDLILEAGGHPLSGREDLAARVDAASPGDTLDLSVYREGRLRSIPVALGTETYQRVRTLSLGLALSTDLDLFPDPEFNFLSLLRYSRHTEPARLLAPEARYLAGIVQAVGDDPRDIALPGRGWDAWLLILGFGSRDHVLAQE